MAVRSAVFRGTMPLGVYWMTKKPVTPQLTARRQPVRSTRGLVIKSVIDAKPAISDMRRR